MFTLDRTVLLWTGFLALCIKAQTPTADYGCGTPTGIVQCLWVAPSLPDESTKITLGETYTLQWDDTLQDNVAKFLPGADPNNLALFITPSDGSSGETQVSGSVNINATQSLTWVVQTINPGNWTFRFLEYGTSYNTGGNQLSSPQVVVLAASASPSTTTSSATAHSSHSSSVSASSVSASGVSTSSGSTSSVSAPPAATTSAQAGSSKSSSSSLSGGAIAGIVIGVVIIILMIVGMFLFFRKRSGSKERSAASEDSADSAHAMNNYKYSLPEPHGTTTAHAHMMANTQPKYQPPYQPPYEPPSELEGSHNR